MHRPKRQPSPSPAPAPSTTTKSVPAKQPTVASSSVAPVASADVSELRSEVAELRSLVQQLQSTIVASEKSLNSDIKKYVKSVEDTLKKDFQRGETNARSFQDNASKKIEGIETSVTNEVRRIREKTREAMVPMRVRKVGLQSFH